MFFDPVAFPHPDLLPLDEEFVAGFHLTNWQGIPVLFNIHRTDGRLAFRVGDACEPLTEIVVANLETFARDARAALSEAAS